MFLGFKAYLPVILIALGGVSACANTTKDLSASTQPAQVPPQQMHEPVRFAQKLNLEAGQAITVRNDFGDVHLRFGGFANELELTAVAQAPTGAVVPEVRFDAQTGQFDAYLAPGATVARGQRADLVAFVPEGHPVSVQTLSGNVEVRSVRADVTIRSNSGAISVRGVRGAIDAQTGSGSIEVAFVDDAVAPTQRLQTSTGTIIASFGAQADARLNLASSGLFGTEFSVEIAAQPGQEPNKTGVVRLGNAQKQIDIQSKRGELRLYRRSAFVDVDG